MTEPSLPGMDMDRLGVIGRRQLVTIQTLHIARLTSHPVGIIPETFVAVTGKGPVDSNESGKTSFLAAVSLLLGDPEWRVSGTGASSVEALLFEPVTAGAPAGVHAATEGYIVGVFADPDDIAGSACTVWMKISSGRPHIQVRHARGLQLAVGATDPQRHEAAPGIYRSLGGEPLGGREYAQVLYGRSPRVLAYVASRGRTRSRPSLLKLDAGTFSPEQIGDALVTLAGRAPLFDHDQQDRRDLAAKQAELANQIEADAEQTRHEDGILNQVAARDKLRALAADAVALWSSHLARAVLDAYARSESAVMLLDKAKPELDKRKEQLTDLKSRRKALRDQAALRAKAADTADHANKLNQKYDQTVREEGGLRSDLGRVEGELNRSRNAAFGHDVERDGDAIRWTQSRDEIGKALATARGRHDEAAAALSALEHELVSARDGQFGDAGAAMRVLAEQEIPSTALAAAVRLSPESRTNWESRLAPWRDAVCVATEHLADALNAMADRPGTLIVTPPPEEHYVRAQTSRTSRLPDGVLAAPDEAEALLWLLADQDFVAMPVPHALDERSGLRVIGGFDTPVIGHEDLMAHLEKRLRVATKEVATLKSGVESLDKEFDRVRRTVLRAEAAEAVLVHVKERKRLNDALTACMIAMPGLKEERDQAWRDAEDTKRALRDRELDIRQLDEEIRQVEGKVRSHEAEIGRLKQASVPDDTLLAAWGRGRDAARGELRWPTEALIEDGDRLLDEATAPPLIAGSPNMERRRASALLSAARGHLDEALATVAGRTMAGQGAPPQHVVLAAEQYQRARKGGEENDDGSSFESVLDNLRSWLEEEADRDAAAPEQIHLTRADRASKIDFVTTQARRLEQALRDTQGAIIERASSALEGIKRAVNRLNHKAGGDGADLIYKIIPPGAPDHDWVCQVTPRWRRNPGGAMLPYDNVTNTAQEKLFSIHLVLAALLAAPDARGRVLILDELADSLGAEHRREVLDAIATAAQEHRITILATCQDSIIAEAKPYCREVLYFHYPSKSMPLNRPTRMFGFDRNGDRVELTADELREGRGQLR